jgi:hypothetical protein
VIFTQSLASVGASALAPAEVRHATSRWMRVAEG